MMNCLWIHILFTICGLHVLATDVSASDHHADHLDIIEKQYFKPIIREFVVTPDTEPHSEIIAIAELNSDDDIIIADKKTTKTITISSDTIANVLQTFASNCPALINRIEYEISQSKLLKINHQYDIMAFKTTILYVMYVLLTPNSNNNKFRQFKADEIAIVLKNIDKFITCQDMFNLENPAADTISPSDAKIIYRKYFLHFNVLLKSYYEILNNEMSQYPYYLSYAFKNPSIEHSTSILPKYQLKLLHNIWDKNKNNNKQSYNIINLKNINQLYKLIKQYYISMKLLDEKQSLFHVYDIVTRRQLNELICEKMINKPLQLLFEQDYDDSIDSNTNDIIEVKTNIIIEIKNNYFNGIKYAATTDHESIANNHEIPYEMFQIKLYHWLNDMRDLLYQTAIAGNFITFAEKSISENNYDSKKRMINSLFEITLIVIIQPKNVEACNWIDNYLKHNNIDSWDQFDHQNINSDIEHQVKKGIRQFEDYFNVIVYNSYEKMFGVPVIDDENDPYGITTGIFS